MEGDNKRWKDTNSGLILTLLPNNYQGSSELYQRTIKYYLRSK